MAFMSPIHIKARREIWKMIKDCKDCEEQECPEWCREFVRCEMDDLIDWLIKFGMTKATR